jgi:hypothetical protein
MSSTAERTAPFNAHARAQKVKARAREILAGVPLEAGKPIHTIEQISKAARRAEADVDGRVA